MEYGNGETNQLIWKSPENRYHNEEFDVDETNENVNVAMLARFVSSGQSVLDIGCGEGKLGSVLRRKNCLMVGIEIDEKAGRYAVDKAGYRDVYRINVENMDETEESYLNLKKKYGKFDFVALIDVLEHVLNPTSVLMNALKLLKDGGKILISVPNVNNADILLNLMRGHFNYREAGVLDNTHAKYFTKRSFAEWISDVNSVLNDCYLECEYVGGTFGYTDFMERIKKEMPNVYQFVQLNPYFHTIQHLFILKRCDKQNGIPCSLLKLLEEDHSAMLNVLEDCLKKSMSTDMNDKQIEFSVLPNERRILEERAESSELGWKECAIQLEKSQEGWKICEIKLEGVLEEWKNCAIRLENAEKFGKVCEAKLKDAQSGWQKCEQNLEQARDEWRKCDRKLEETRNGWKKCEEEKEKAIIGWRECEKKAESDREELSGEIEKREKRNRELQVQLNERTEEVRNLERIINELNERYQSLANDNEKMYQKNEEILKKWKECAEALEYLKRNGGGA